MCVTRNIRYYMRILNAYFCYRGTIISIFYTATTYIPTQNISTWDVLMDLTGQINALLQVYPGCGRRFCS